MLHDPICCLFSATQFPSIPTLPLKARKSCLIVKNFTSVFLGKIAGFFSLKASPRTFIIHEGTGVYGHFNDLGWPIPRWNSDTGTGLDGCLIFHPGNVYVRLHWIARESIRVARS